MHSDYLLGIDGGGTHCRARLTDRSGRILAEVTGGPANVWSHFTQAIDSVELLKGRAFDAAGLPSAAMNKTALVAGLAGANVASVKALLADWRPSCASLQVISDVEIACVGAHAGSAGAVMIVGTGSQGAAWDGERFTLLGGWGFALSDQGSGAELGRRALRLALLAHEDMTEKTDFTQAVMARFHHSAEEMLLWTRSAMPGDWASVVPEVFSAADAQDPHAVKLIQQTADDIAMMVRRLRSLSNGRIALMGGLASPVEPWLDDDIRALLVAPQLDAMAGALHLARHNASLADKREL
ncbi:BadF/BadG/BcrA/BcrD ATPase family protein [Erwinia sorbitola]|uniref:N-acetylglucosamine kinase n=1 Tax=Erwinia sorbitola TaxID=2681984 RepID=A0A6I6EG86_9GAMM|nr:BadF/BadG/BcrA/BcrD ATPase family protein [Erwinia sorbitola]MTD25862.1 N-acetylglucosamine kinase [Erwinia sorbitola]QGU87588.1 N-acetylglucosamine kinase [Erwinia sorbitola]